MCSSITDKVSLITGESEVMVKLRPPVALLLDGKDVRRAVDSDGVCALLAGGPRDCVAEASRFPETVAGIVPLPVADCAVRTEAASLMPRLWVLLLRVPLGAGVVYTAIVVSTTLASILMVKHGNSTTWGLEGSCHLPSGKRPLVPLVRCFPRNLCAVRRPSTARRKPEGSGRQTYHPSPKSSSLPPH